MGKYQITTADGTYEVETEDSPTGSKAAPAYEDPSASELAGILGHSTMDNIQGLGQAVMHPLDTASAIGHKGMDVANQVYNAPGIVNKADILGDNISSIIPGGNTLYHIAGDTLDHFAHGTDMKQWGDYARELAKDEGGLPALVGMEGLGRGIKALGEVTAPESNAEGLVGDVEKPLTQAEKIKKIYEEKVDPLTKDADARIKPINVGPDGNPVKGPLYEPDWEKLHADINNSRIPPNMRSQARQMIEDYRQAWKDSNGSIASQSNLRKAAYDTAYPSDPANAPMPEVTTNKAFKDFAENLANKIKTSVEENFDLAAPENAGQLKNAHGEIHDLFKAKEAPVMEGAPIEPSGASTGDILKGLLGKYGNTIFGGAVGALGVSHPMYTGMAAAALGAGKLAAMAAGTGPGQALTRTISGVMMSQAGQLLVRQMEQQGQLPPDTSNKILNKQMSPEDQNAMLHTVVTTHPDMFEPSSTGLASEITDSSGKIKLMDPQDVLQYDSMIPAKYPSSIHQYRAQNAVRTDGTVLQQQDLPPLPQPKYTSDPKSRDVGDGFMKKIPSPDDTNQVGATDMNQVDHSFLQSAEGFKTTGYVPQDNGQVIGHSGVTVGAGVDLGQMSKGEIAALPVSSDLKGKLFKYATLTGQEASNALKSQPLKLSTEEAQELTQAVHSGIIDKFSAQFDQDSPTSYSNLPPQAQTVLASLATNFGPSLKDKLPTLYDLVSQGDFQGAASFLKETHWKQPQLRARRLKEAELLASIPSSNGPIQA